MALDLSALLTLAVQSAASDLHLSSGEPPILRVHGDLHRFDAPTLAPEAVQVLIDTLLDDAQQRTFAEEHELDFAYDAGELGRFRVNVFMQQRGAGAVFRLIPATIPTIEQLGLPPILKKLCEKRKGLILVTGPTGSGKSTTLAAMIAHINQTTPGHIVTIEDPIEFIHQSQRCLVNQREVGLHTHSFANALRAALREDPDVILVGEMRDLETIQLAITAAETGHLVFATLHAPSAPQTVERVISVFPAAQQAQVRMQFADSIEAVITQTLCKKKSGGRVAALEILLATAAVRNLIRESKVHQLPSAMQVGQKDGMQLLDAALVDLVNKNVITREEAQAKGAVFTGSSVSGPNSGRPPTGRGF